MLHFPTDITDAVVPGDINLPEVGQVARLTALHLDFTPAQARSTRSEDLTAHLRMRGSQNVLRAESTGARVKDILVETIKVSTVAMTRVIATVYELLEINPADQQHLFYEEMKPLFYAMREVEPKDIDNTTLKPFMTADELSNVIFSFK